MVLVRPLRAAFALLLLAAALFAPAQVQSSTYRLQVDDVVRIRVYLETQIDNQIVVGPDGNITAPFVGIVRAEGLTTTELASVLKDKYIQVLKLRDPIVSVTIERFRPITAIVGGFVQRPGQYQFRPGDTLLTLLMNGGGPIPDRADLRRATLRRKGFREVIPIDLFDLLNRGDVTQNYVVQDGDELIIPELVNGRILVLGVIRAPGVYNYKEPMTLLDAVTLAGGEIPRRSRFSKIKITRPLPGQPGNYIQIEANLVRFLAQGDSSQNVLLQPGDLVYVPDSGNIDFDQINAIANVFFILERFGIRLLPF